MSENKFSPLHFLKPTIFDCNSSTSVTSRLLRPFESLCNSVQGAPRRVKGKTSSASRYEVNPSLSAQRSLQEIDYQSCGLFLCPKRCTKNAPTPFLRTSMDVFQIPHIPHFLFHFLVLPARTKCVVYFFCHFRQKNARKKEPPS